jgi:RecG-like helicase
MSEQGGLRGALGRLFDGQEEREQEELGRAAQKCGAQPIEACNDRDTVTVSGRVRSVVFRPQRETPKLVVELYDGTATLTLVWLGRRSIPGIEPGAHVRASGRVSRSGDRAVIYNPRYELMAPESLG